MRSNHEYCCKCTWRTKGINKTATNDRQTWPPLIVGLPVTSERYWANFQVTRLFYNATVSQCDHFVTATYVFVVWNFTRLIIFLTTIWWGSSKLLSIYYLRRILISRPPRVFRRLKRRSYYLSGHVKFKTTWSKQNDAPNGRTVKQAYCKAVYDHSVLSHPTQNAE